MDKFELNEEHIKLLRRAYIGWEDCEFGAPAIDCKRPYGNSSVYSDIAKILDIKAEDGDEGFTREQESLMWDLHAGTQQALQIILHTGEFKLGKYVKEGYGTKWRYIGE